MGGKTKREEVLPVLSSLFVACGCCYLSLVALSPLCCIPFRPLLPFVYPLQRLVAGPLPPASS